MTYRCLNCDDCYGSPNSGAVACGNSGCGFRVGRYVRDDSVETSRIVSSHELRKALKEIERKPASLSKPEIRDAIKTIKDELADRQRRQAFPMVIYAAMIWAAFALHGWGQQFPAVNGMNDYREVLSLLVSVALGVYGIAALLWSVFKLME